MHREAIGRRTGHIGTERRPLHASRGGGSRLEANGRRVGRDHTEALSGRGEMRRRPRHTFVIAAGEVRRELRSQHGNLSPCGQFLLFKYKKGTALCRQVSARTSAAELETRESVITPRDCRIPKRQLVSRAFRFLLVSPAHRRGAAVS